MNLFMMIIVALAGMLTGFILISCCLNRMFKSNPGVVEAGVIMFFMMIAAITIVGCFVLTASTIVHQINMLSR